LINYFRVDDFLRAPPDTAIIVIFAQLFIYYFSGLFVLGSRNRGPSSIHVHGSNTSNSLGAFSLTNNGGGSQLSSSGSHQSGHSSLHPLMSSSGAASIDMECESPRLSNNLTAGGSSNSSAYHNRAVAPIPAGGGITLSHVHHHSHLHRSSGSSGSGSSYSRHPPPPHIVSSSLLSSDAVNVSPRVGGNGNYGSSSGIVRAGGGVPTSMPLGVDFAPASNNVGSNYPSYLNMNLTNGLPLSSTLDCTLTGSLNMPLGVPSSGSGLQDSPITDSSVPNFNMNLNLGSSSSGGSSGSDRMASHHQLSSLGGNIGSGSSANSHSSMTSSFPPPPSQFLGNIPLSTYSSSTSGLVYSGNGGGNNGGSDSASSASSGGSNLLMSLSSRGGGPGGNSSGSGLRNQPTFNNSSEEDRDRDDSPMLCAQQSPVASH